MTVADNLQPFQPNQTNMDAAEAYTEAYTGVEADEAAIAPSEIPTDIDPDILETVTVTSEKLQGRQRRITAQISIPQTIENVWRVLTDYEHLADFIPNLAKSRRLPDEEGQIRIEQIGSQCLFNLKFCARVVLQMQEQFPQRIGFEMLEGDFKGFNGAWKLAETLVDGKASTVLTYELMVLPRLTMPIGLIEKRLRHDMAVNLSAIYQRTLAVSA